MNFFKVIPLVFLLFANASFGFNIFSSALQMYRCQSESEAVSCKSCVKFAANESIDSTNFKIDVEKSYVLRESIKKGDVVQATVLKNCVVINKKNWQCKDELEMTALGNYSRSKFGMTNGQYYSSVEVNVSPIPHLNVQGMHINRYTCGK